MERYTNIIKKNSYICKLATYKNDVHSFNNLAPIKMSQQQNIMLGKCVEEFFRAFVIDNNVKSICEKTKKGEKETDHLYINEKEKTIIYCEQKNNINLDTEKSVETKNKVKQMREQIKRKYPDYTIECYIFAARYLSKDETVAKDIIKRKYKDIDVIGVNDFLKLFDIEPIEDYDMYKKIIHEICVRKFKVNSS